MNRSTQTFGSALVSTAMLAMLTSACSPIRIEWDDDDDWEDEGEWDEWDEEEDEDSPPEIEVEEIRVWPPLGPDDSIEFEVFDDDGDLSTVGIAFGAYRSLGVTNTRAGVYSVSASSLESGMGDLRIHAQDRRRNTADHFREGLLIDLDPPEVDFGTMEVLRADGNSDPIQFWVGDAWVLGGYRVLVDANGSGGPFEEVLSVDFQDGYPSTTGEEWDWSIEMLTMEELGLVGSTSGEATLRIELLDAAGNLTTTQTQLSIDAIEPTAQVMAPAPGEVVSGAFTVVAEGLDDQLLPATVDILVGGELVMTAPGDMVEITVDAGAFSPGPLSIQARVEDEAGHVTLTEPVWVTVAD